MTRRQRRKLLAFARFLRQTKCGNEVATPIQCVKRALTPFMLQQAGIDTQTELAGPQHNDPEYDWYSVQTYLGLTEKEAHFLFSKEHFPNGFTPNDIADRITHESSEELARRG